jgi:hypothetical protein
LESRLQPLVILLSSEDGVTDVVCGCSFTGHGDGRAGCEIGTAEKGAAGEDVYVYIGDVVVQPGFIWFHVRLLYMHGKRFLYVQTLYTEAQTPDPKQTKSYSKRIQLTIRSI